MKGCQETMLKRIFFPEFLALSEFQPIVLLPY